MYEDRFIQAAYAYLYVGLFDEAMDAFARAIEANPSRPEPYFHASVTAHRNGNLDDALRFALQAMKLAPEEPLYEDNWRAIWASQLAESGRLAFFDGDTSRAVQLYREALAHDPLHLEARRQLEEICQLYPSECGEAKEENLDQ